MGEDFVQVKNLANSILTLIFINLSPVKRVERETYLHCKF